MRILVNYQSKDQAYLPILQYFLREKGFQAVATNASLSIGDLIAKAQIAQCEAIFCCNEDTLRQLVPEDKPTLDS